MKPISCWGKDFPLIFMGTTKKRSRHYVVSRQMDQFFLRSMPLRSLQDDF